MLTYQDLFENLRQYLVAQTERGERIDSEADLAKRFQVSRYQIRKVLATLSQMGLLERAPKKGSKMRKPDTEEMSEQIQFQFELAGFDPGEFTEARVIIECALIPLAIRRVTPSMLSRLENALSLIEQHADNPLEADRHDRDFHLLLLKACGNRVLEVFSGVLITYFEKTASHIASKSKDYFLDTVYKERAILSAMKQGNAELAVDLLKKHLIEKTEPGF